MIEIIRFETFQSVSFAIASSLFLYLTLAFISWFVRAVVPRRKRVVMKGGP